METIYGYIKEEYKRLFNDITYKIVNIIIFCFLLIFLFFAPVEQRYIMFIFFFFNIYLLSFPFFYIIYFIFNYLVYKFKGGSYKQDNTGFVMFFSFMKELIIHVVGFIFMILLISGYLLNPIGILNYLKSTFFFGNVDSYTFILFNFLIFFYLIELIYKNIKIIFNKYFLYFIIGVHIILYYINGTIFNIYLVLYYLIFLFSIFPFISKNLFDSNYYNAGLSKTSFRISIKDKKGFIEPLKDFLYLINKGEEQDYINLEIDKPITNKQEDDESGLGHYIIAKKIYDLILGIKLESLQNSYSIGIVGEWGIGKSGIVNILKNTWLENRSDFIYYEFNPWNFEKKDLIENFFSDLSKKLGISNISLSLKAYSNIISGIEPIKSYGFIKDIISIFIPDKTLNERKEEINNKLKESNKRIVISIDDLDRCEPDEIIIMLNLIKNLGNFKNIFYLVSYDKDNILNILKEKKFGENYLDKIINHEIYVPNPDKNQIEKYFKNNLEEILNYVLKNDFKNNLIREVFINKRFEIFSQKYIELTLGIKATSTDINLLFEKENFRFIKRLLNQLNIVLSKKYDKKNNILFEGEFSLYIIIVINYVKLKDYKYFNFILSILKDLNSGREVIYNKENLDLFMKRQNEFFKSQFFEHIAGLYLTYNDKNEYYFKKNTITLDISKVIANIEKYS